MSVSDHQRIGGRLDVDQLVLRLDGRLHGVEVAGVDVLDLDAVVLDDVVEEARRAAVDIVRADQVVAGAAAWPRAP